MIYDPSSHDQDQPVLHQITITAMVPMLTTAQAAVDRDALLELLAAHPEYIEEVTSLRAVPDPDHHPRCATHIDHASRCTCVRERAWDNRDTAEDEHWRHPDTGLTEEQDTERGS